MLKLLTNPFVLTFHGDDFCCVTIEVPGVSGLRKISIQKFLMLSPKKKN